ncbi:MAG: WYL domain-containing protein [Paracoccaceae bacterium]
MSAPLFPPDAALRHHLVAELLSRTGTLHLTRRLSRAFGTRRRDLRAELRGCIAAGTPMAFIGRNRLVWTGKEERVVLHLSSDEVTTLITALRAIRQHGRSRSMLGDAADILHQVMGSLSPGARRRHIALAGGDLSLLPPVIGPDGRPGSPVRAAVLTALHEERALRFVYSAADGARTAREVWPAGLTYHGSCLLAFCTLRQDFRTFRIDAIAAPEVGRAMPKSRADLLADWRRHDPEEAEEWDPLTGEAANPGRD